MSSAFWYDTGHIINILQMNVFYKREGQGEALCCIHGFPSSSWDFAPIWPALAAQFDVIASDLIGLGRSAKPRQPLPIALQADIIEGLLLKEGIDKAHILAHDLGDTVAQELLARQYYSSSKVQWLSCVFLNGGLFPETHKALFIQKLLLSPFGSLMVRFMTKRSLKKNFTRIFSEAHPPTQGFIDDTWTLCTENNGLSMIPRLIKYMEERKTHRERWVRPLQQAVVPIRLINGIEDPISGLHAAERFTELIPNADVVLLENSGHYPHIETPEKVLKAFFEFHAHL